VPRRFIDDGHLLKRERTLEVLAVVQAAAEDKVAFEQCPGVAENLENFVLRHGAKILSSKFQVQSPKS